ncbi:MAG: dprA [Acidimicrobiia bacterium]|nr:dprA [Acidimicrobiia bacterium]
MSATLPEEAYALGLTALSPALGPRRLREILGEFEPPQAWAALCRGTLPDGLVASPRQPDVDRTRAAWELSALAIDLPQLWDRSRAMGAQVAVLGRPGYPARLADDIAPPAVLCWLGDLSLLDRPAVAIVGTRSASFVGKAIAQEFGRDLATAGVAVVSGLATGIDGAAHTGALQRTTGGAVGVIAGGLDVVYPPSHQELWWEVGRRGLLLSEAAPGVRPEAWRFPQRNRIIAALADVLVVVESRLSGGSMHTVREAEQRGRQVLAVPGSVRSPLAAGTNQLLTDGCAPARDALDVLVALGMVTESGRGRRTPELEADYPFAWLLRLLEVEPLDADGLAARSGCSLEEVAVAIANLEGAGLLAQRDGWYEAVHR